MPKCAFSARWVAAVKPAQDRQVDYFDTKPPNLALRVSAHGRKSWCIFYRSSGRLRRYTLGTYPDLSLADARQRASDLRHAIAQGDDPADDKQQRRTAPTVAELAQQYLEGYAKVHKRSWDIDARILRREVSPHWGGQKAQEITRRDVVALLDRVVQRGAPASANRVLDTLRKMYNWAISRDLVEVNPCYQVRRPAKTGQRDRVLTQTEIRTVWEACEHLNPRYRILFRLQLLTAQRMGELRQMRWEDLDLSTGWWTIPAELSKNGLAHRVPLSPQALDLMIVLDRTAASPWVFASRRLPGQPLARTAVQKASVTLRAHAEVTFAPHDLRRTAASHMTGMGISRVVVSKILNHVERGVIRVYDRHSYDREKREALERWGRHVETLVTGQAPRGTVVPLRRETVT